MIWNQITVSEEATKGQKNTTSKNTQKQSYINTQKIVLRRFGTKPSFHAVLSADPRLTVTATPSETPDASQ